MIIYIVLILSAMNFVWKGGVIESKFVVTRAVLQWVPGRNSAAKMRNGVVQKTGGCPDLRPFSMENLTTLEMLGCSIKTNPYIPDSHSDFCILFLFLCSNKNPAINGGITMFDGFFVFLSRPSPVFRASPR